MVFGSSNELYNTIFPTPFIYTVGIRRFISHPQTYDDPPHIFCFKGPDPQVQLLPCHSLGPTEGGPGQHLVLVVQGCSSLMCSVWGFPAFPNATETFAGPCVF